MITDKVADMLTRIRNGYLARKQEVVIPHSRLLEDIAKVLKEEQYLADYKVAKNEKGFKELTVTLLFVDGKPVLTKLNRISKPGLRIYKGYSQFFPILSGMGISIISTSKGVMTGKQARKQKIGGEVLCELW